MFSKARKKYWYDFADSINSIMPFRLVFINVVCAFCDNSNGILGSQNKG